MTVTVKADSEDWIKVNYEHVGMWFSQVSASLATMLFHSDIVILCTEFLFVGFYRVNYTSEMLKALAGTPATSQSDL